MTDQTSSGPFMTAPRRMARKPGIEFCIYFATIFVATLPLALLTWALATIRAGRWQDRGPIARAWSQAWIITPMIFSA